jgi:hypothetical protein
VPSQASHRDNYLTDCSKVWRKSLDFLHTSFTYLHTRDAPLWIICETSVKEVKGLPSHFWSITQTLISMWSLWRHFSIKLIWGGKLPPEGWNITHVWKKITHVWKKITPVLFFFGQVWFFNTKNGCEGHPCAYVLQANLAGEQPKTKQLIIKHLRLLAFHFLYRSGTASL